MKAAKRIRAYLDRIQQDAPQTRDITGYLDGPSITRKDLEAVLARLDGYKDLRRQVQKTQTMRTELAAALGFQTPAPFIPYWRDLLITARNTRRELTEERAERARLASQLAAAENVVRAQKVLLSEIQDAADQVTGAHLFYRTWTSVPEQIKALGDALSEARAKLSGGALHEQVRDLQRMLRKQRDAAQELRELRNKLTDLLGVGTGDFTDWSNE